MTSGPQFWWQPWLAFCSCSSSFKSNHQWMRSVVAFHHLHVGHQQDIYACSIYVTYASIIRILIIDPPIHDPFVDHQYSHGRTPPGAPEKAGVLPVTTYVGTHDGIPITENWGGTRWQTGLVFQIFYKQRFLWKIEG